jgi:hypothetical protein
VFVSGRKTPGRNMAGRKTLAARRWPQDAGGRRTPGPQDARQGLA